MGDINYGQVVLTSLAAAVFSTLAFFGKEMWGDRRRNSSNAAKLVLCLEGYTIVCAREIDAAEATYAENGGVVVPLLKVPKLNIPDDVYFWAISECVHLREVPIKSIVYLFDCTVKGAWNEGLPEDFYDDAREKIAKLALIAWGLASSVRKDYKMPEPKYSVTNWDFISLLNSRSGRELK